MLSASGNTFDGKGRVHDAGGEALGDQLSDVLDRLFPSSDPLDSALFDATSYINSKFSAEDETLVRLAPFTSELERRLEDLDREIDDGVKRASTSGTRAQQDVADAKTAIAGLAAKLKDIRLKSITTSTSITDLCSDIKKLDQAKKNLTTAITALERMQMLSTATSKLQKLHYEALHGKEYRYRESAGLLQTINELYRPFIDFETRKVPKVLEIRAQMEIISRELTERVVNDFKKVGCITERTAKHVSNDVDRGYDGEGEGDENVTGETGSAAVGSRSRVAALRAQTTKARAKAKKDIKRANRKVKRRGAYDVSDGSDSDSSDLSMDGDSGGDDDGSEDDNGKGGGSNAGKDRESDEETGDRSRASSAEEVAAAAAESDLLRDAALVVDALPAAVKRSVLETFCEEQMRPYDELFRAASAVVKENIESGLLARDSTAADKDDLFPPWAMQSIERRFAWFKRLGKAHVERFGVHPGGLWGARAGDSSGSGGGRGRLGVGAAGTVSLKLEGGEMRITGPGGGPATPVFPEHWQVTRRLALAFAQHTAQHLAGVLAGFDPPESAPVPPMLKALNKVLAFERMAGQKYEIDDEIEGEGDSVGVNGRLGDFGGDSDDAEDEEEVFFDEEGNEITGAAAIRLKYSARLKKRKQAEQVERLRREKEDKMRRIDIANGAAHGSVLVEAGSVERGDESNSRERLPRFRGIISSSFEPFLCAYVAWERRNMEDLISAQAQEEASFVSSRLAERNSELARIKAEDGGAEAEAAEAGIVAQVALGSVGGNPAQDELAAFSLDLAGGEQMGSGLTVASSSVAVFNYIKTSARRCATLNTGLAFFNLSKTFAGVLRTYAASMLKRLPKPSTPLPLPGQGRASSSSSSSSGSNWMKAMTGGGIRSTTSHTLTMGGLSLNVNVPSIGGGKGSGGNNARDAAADTTESTGVSTTSYALGATVPEAEATVLVACVVVNTAEWCAETVEQLSTMLEGKVDAAFKEHIQPTFDDIGDEFYGVVSTAVRVLVTGIGRRLEPGLQSLASTNWAVVRSVGDISQYVLRMEDTLKRFVPLVAACVSPAYFRLFCNKFAEYFLPRYMGTLHSIAARGSSKSWKSKKKSKDAEAGLAGGRTTRAASVAERREQNALVSEEGASQLLLDVSSVKTLILGLPSTGAFGEGSGGGVARGRGAAYAKYVQRELLKAELLFKLVATPPDIAPAALAANFRLYWPSGTDEDLRRVAVLKGFSQNEEEEAVEAVKAQRE